MVAVGWEGDTVEPGPWTQPDLLRERLHLAVRDLEVTPLSNCTTAATWKIFTRPQRGASETLRPSRYCCASKPNTHTLIPLQLWGPKCKTGLMWGSQVLCNSRVSAPLCSPWRQTWEECRSLGEPGLAFLVRVPGS